MPIIEPVIRPPAESSSFLVQITTGCSANHCGFCGAYMGKSFAIKDFNEISSDILEEKAVYPDTRRVFLLDGDALAVKNERLIPILTLLNKTFPNLTRITSYAMGYNITTRSPAELKELFEQKLRLIYIGLESGSQEILDRCHKQSSVDEMIRAVHNAAEAGIKSSVIVLLGLGGKKYSTIHVRDTITALNTMQPRYLSLLSLMLIPGTPMHADHDAGRFKQLDAHELLQETHDIIQGLTLTRTIFRSNHASNYLPLEGRFPQDKEKLLYTIQQALDNKIDLKPEYLRGL